MKLHACTRKVKFFFIETLVMFRNVKVEGSPLKQFKEDPATSRYTWFVCFTKQCI